MNRIRRFLGESDGARAGAPTSCGLLVLALIAASLLATLPNANALPPAPVKKTPGDGIEINGITPNKYRVLPPGLVAPPVVGKPPSAKDVEVTGARHRGLQLYYSFDDDSSGKVCDESGNELHGRTVGDVRYQPSFRGRAANFTSNKTYILCDDLCMDRWRRLTASCWIKTNRITNHAQVMACGEVVGDGMSGFVMQVGGTSKAVWNVTTEFHGRSRKGQSVVTSSLLASRMKRVGKWVHVVGVFDGTFVKFYINGKLDAKNEAANLAPIIWNPKAHKLVIGNTAAKTRMTWVDKYFDGLIDEVKIWNRALAAEEIAAIYSHDSTLIAGQSEIGASPRAETVGSQPRDPTFYGGTQHNVGETADNFVADPATSSHQLPVAWGLESEGLRMRLSITNRSGVFSNLHDFRVEIENRRKTPVHLAGQLESSAPQVNSYEEYLRHAVWFTTTPKLEPSFAGSDDGAPRQPVQVTIEAGTIYTARWTQAHDQLGTNSGNHGFQDLFRDGRYEVRAHVELTTADREKISLSSDRQYYVVGDRNSPPHRSLAQVVRPNDTANSVQLNVGGNDDIRVGDVFMIYRKGRGHWGLKITEVERDRCTAKVSVHIDRPDERGFPKLPPAGTIVWLHAPRMDAVDPRKVAWSAQHQNLVIGIKLNANKYVAGDAMVFDLYAKNVGREVLEIPSMQQALESGLWTIVFQASGKPGKFICRRLVGDLIPLPQDQLKPNEVRSTRIDIRSTTLQTGKEFVATLPVGKYVVSLEYQSRFGKAEPKLIAGWYEIEIADKDGKKPHTNDQSGTGITLDPVIAASLSKLDKPQQALVVAVNSETRTLTLDVGSNHGVREGDRYSFSFQREKPRFKAYQPVEIENVQATLEVVDVYKTDSTARMMNRFIGVKYPIASLGLNELLGHVVESGKRPIQIKYREQTGN